jgi:hypothetical protein
MLTDKKRITRRKPRVNASSSTTNLTWSSLGSKPGLLGEISATKRLGRGSAPVFRGHIGLIKYSKMKQKC